MLITKIIASKTKTGYKVSPIFTLNLDTLPEGQNIDQYLQSEDFMKHQVEAANEALKLGKIQIDWVN
jgi:hypothetical protein